MKQKTYIKLTAGMFSIIAVLHLSRLVFQWDVVFGGWQAPLWISMIGTVVAGFLAYTAFKLQK